MVLLLIITRVDDDDDEEREKGSEKCERCSIIESRPKDGGVL